MWWASLLFVITIFVTASPSYVQLSTVQRLLVINFPTLLYLSVDVDAESMVTSNDTQSIAIAILFSLIGATGSNKPTDRLQWFR